jgi:hypothetical protein
LLDGMAEQKAHAHLDLKYMYSVHAKSHTTCMQA